MMRLLVTGGAGYIGSHAVLEFLRAGHDAVVVDNLSNSCEESLRRVAELAGRAPVFYRVDLLDESALNRVFENEDPFDAVVHFAGLKAVGESVEQPLRYVHNNVTGSLHLFRAMERHGPRALVFSSSATVYGVPERVPITEDAPLGAVNPYGRTKLTIEDILRDLAAADADWRIALLRYFNPVGADESGRIGEDPSGIPNNLMPYIAQTAVGRRPFVRVFGNDYSTPDGTGVRDYIHVTDLALGHLRALEYLGAHTGIRAFNLGAGRGYSVLEMVYAFSQICGHEVPFEMVERRPGDVDQCYADPSRAEAELRWKATRGLQDMCRTAWNWQTRNPEGYSTDHG